MEENVVLQEDRGQNESRFNFDLETLKNPVVIGVAAFVVGLFIGLVVLGWNLTPVVWKDASPEHLRPDLREDYMRMVIDSYELRDDLSLAEERIENLGETAPETFNAVNENRPPQSDFVFVLFEPLIGGVPPTEETEEPSNGGPLSRLFSNTGLLFLVMCGFTIILAGGLVGMYLLRRRGVVGEPTAAQQAMAITRQTEVTDFDDLGDGSPLAQWMTTYLLGDDLFDDSFSIDAPTGEFMGECGVGIADTIGVGDPKRVSAFEVWLFDKNDIQTVTKVLMSTHAFNDDATHERLAAKGEPITAFPGTEIVLETETLQMVARIVDMSFGEGALPDDSFFDRITLELAVWQKVPQS
jgi:hypothetical protein